MPNCLAIAERCARPLLHHLARPAGPRFERTSRRLAAGAVVARGAGWPRQPRHLGSGKSSDRSADGWPLAHFDRGTAGMTRQPTRQSASSWSTKVTSPRGAPRRRSGSTGRRTPFHPLLDLQGRRAPQSARRLRAARRDVLGPCLVVGPFPRRHRGPPQVGRAHGLRRARRDRPRPLRRPLAGLPGRRSLRRPRGGRTGKLFPTLSEDRWPLHADGYGGSTPAIRFTARDRFEPCAEPPADHAYVPVAEWRAG